METWGLWWRRIPWGKRRVMIRVVWRLVPKLARRFGEKFGFAEGVGVVRLFGSVGMKGKGTCFRSESLLMVLEENFVAKQLRLEIMKSGLTITLGKGKELKSRVYTIDDE